jgi:hypothetical protein
METVLCPLSSDCCSPSPVPSLRSRWLVALESGEYEQGTDFLRNENTFCCLGVLCNIYNKENWKKGIYVFNGFEHDTLPPITILQEAGLTASDAKSLASLNDSGKDFEFIARHIRTMYTER